MNHPADDEYRVLQALSEDGDPLDTFDVFRGDRKVRNNLTPEQVKYFFDGKNTRPVRDESRLARCPICNIALPPESPRHVQTPDGLVTRGHRYVR